MQVISVLALIIYYIEIINIVGLLKTLCRLIVPTTELLLSPMWIIYSYISDINLYNIRLFRFDNFEIIYIFLGVIGITFINLLYHICNYYKNKDYSHNISTKNIPSTCSYNRSLKCT